MPQNLALPLDSLAFALASAAAFAALDLAQKWTARYAVSAPEPFLALRLLGGALLSPLLLLLPGIKAPHLDAHAWGLLAALVAANFLGNVLYLRIVYRADISVVGSLWPLKNFYLPIFALFTTQQRFPFAKYLWLAVAILGALGIAYNEKLRWQAIKQAPVLWMLFGAVPVFAVSDLILGAATAAIGSGWTTVLVSWGIALVGLPYLLARRENRTEITRALRGWRGQLGACLTGVFLVLGVYCISEAFRRAFSVAPSARGLVVVLVNVFAMLSGLFLLAVNAALPGRLDESMRRRVYLVRLVGAILLVTAALYVAQK